MFALRRPPLLRARPPPAVPPETAPRPEPQFAQTTLPDQPARQSQAPIPRANTRWLPAADETPLPVPPHPDAVQALESPGAPARTSSRGRRFPSAGRIRAILLRSATQCLVDRYRDCSPVACRNSARGGLVLRSARVRGVRL